MIFINNKFKLIRPISFVFLIFLGFGFGTGSIAGQQQYEELQISTKLLMLSQISDTKPMISSFENEVVKNNWLNKQSLKLKNKFNNEVDLIDFLTLVHYESTRAGFDPELILGLIKVESGFKKYAISSVGAMGLMQVMPFWIDIIGDKSNNLFHIKTNLRYGCTILRHYVMKEKGDISRGLGRYNGSLGNDKYPNAVLSAMKEYRI